MEVKARETDHYNSSRKNGSERHVNMPLESGSEAQSSTARHLSTELKAAI